MKTQELSFVFARLNLMIDYTTENKADKLAELLSEKASIIEKSKSKKQNNIWSFTSIVRFEHNKQTYFLGNLTKYVDLDHEEVVTEHKIEKTTVKNKVKGKAIFILECNSGLIACNFSSNSISKLQFKNKLIELCRQNINSPLFPVDLSFIDDKRTIFDKIDSWQKITSISINLHPSNPSSNKIWDDLDKKMKKYSIDEYNPKYKSHTGIDLNIAIDIKRELAMASDGYGLGRVEGIKDNATVSTDTQISPYTEKINIQDDNDEKRKYNNVVSSLKKLQKRLHDNEKI